MSLKKVPMRNAVCVHSEASIFYSAHLSIFK